MVAKLSIRAGLPTTFAQTFAVAATAILAFVAGILTDAKMFRPRPAEAATITLSTISPIELHRQLKSDDVPVQYVKPGDLY